MSIVRGVAGCLAIVLAAVLPMGALVRAVTNLDVVDRVADDDATREAALRYAVARVREAGSLKRLAKTPLRLSDHELGLGVSRGLRPKVLASTLRPVYVGVTRRISGRSRPVVILDATQLRNWLIAGIAEQLIYKLEHLPDCDFGNDVSALWQGVSGYVSGRSDEKTLAAMPNCRPPGPVHNAIVSGINQHARDQRAPKRTVVLARGSSPALLSALGWFYRYGYGWWLLVWLVALAASAVVFVGRRWRDRGFVAKHARTLMVVLVASWGVLAMVVAASAWHPGPASRLLTGDAETAPLVAPLVAALSAGVAWRLALLVLGLTIAGAVAHWRYTVRVD